MRSRWFALALAPLAAVVALEAACGDPSHTFEGRLFREDRICLDTSTGVDVVEGDPPGECGPTCLAQPEVDGGRTIYVATMCGPYPFAFDASGADPACPAALAALARNDTCLGDGGSTSPDPAALDAAADAPTD